MATEKTINTRIQLKYSSLEEWSDLSVAGKGGNLVLKAGEVGICAVPRGGSHLQTTPPAIMFKVGDGTTAFKDLPWASGLAADVYPWAKAKDPPAIGNGKIIINQAGAKKGEFTVNQTGDTTIELTDNNSDTNTQYKLELEGHKLILKSKEIGETTWNTVASTITLPDNDTTYTFATGDTDGTFKVTPSGGSAQNVEIKNVMVSTGGAFTGAVTVQAPTADMNPATKQYVDSAIEGVSQFNYKVVTTLPTASADTMGTIYLVKHTHNTEPEVTVGTNDTYDEYLTIQKGSEYSWEKIGNTDIDLSGYYNSLLQTGSGVVTDVSEGASGQIMVTRTSLTTADPTASGTATDFIATVKQDANGKITATKKSVATMTGATASAAGSKGLVPAPAAGDQGKFLRGDGTWVAHDNVSTAFGAGKLIRYYGVCNSLSSEQAKTVSITDFNAEDLTAGKLVMIKFSDGNSASAPTLNINNLGAKNITYRSGTSLTLSDGTYALLYNGTEFELVGELNTDSKVTSAANHYTPKTDSASQLTADAAGGSSAVWNTTQLVTGVNIQRDAKGHVTGLTVDSIKMPANPDTNTAHAHTNGVGLIKTGNGGPTGTVEYKAALAYEERDTNAVVSRPAANANRTYPVIADKNGNLATIVPWTDNSHYESKNVIANSNSGNANSGNTLENGSVYLNHVENGSVTSSHPIVGTGATTVKYAMPGGQIVIDTTKVTDATVGGWGYIKSYTDTNQKISAGTTTFGANDTIEIKAGTNITVDASSATKTITINGKSNDDINSLIDTKIGALDVSNITGFSASKTLKTLTEADGKIAATFQDISITSSQVSDFDTAVENKIKTHTGVDKTGTVTKVEAGTGLKITGTPTTTPKVEIDDSVVFVLNCGSATVNV